MSKGKVYLDVSQARHENCLHIHFEKENNQPSLFFGIYLPYCCEMTTSNYDNLTFRVSLCDWTTWLVILCSVNMADQKLREFDCYGGGQYRRAHCYFVISLKLFR